MKLPEYKAKELLGKYGIKTTKGIVTDDPDKIKSAEISYPVVIKAQIQSGGRGKSGGVKFAENEAEAQDIARTMLKGDIKGYTVDKLLIAEKLEIKDEWYFALMINRESKCPSVIFSASGGVDIEETAKIHPERIVKTDINPLVGVMDYTLRYMIKKSGIAASYFDELFALSKKLYALFMDYCCLLLEINPLALPAARDGLAALDAKIDIDDDALYRLPDIAEFAKSLHTDPKITEAAEFNLTYIPIDTCGEIGVISNGSGMLMSCIDQFAKLGIKVGAGLDLGGGATADRIKEAVSIMLDGDIRTLFICIFGGITRCDEVANGVSDALSQLSQVGADKYIVVRMEGTNKQKGLDILRGRHGVSTVENIPEGTKLIYERMAKER